MYHIQARAKPRDPERYPSEFRNVTLAATSLEAAKARLARLKLADPYREYRIVSERNHIREETP